MRGKYLRDHRYDSSESSEKYWRIDLPAELHYNHWIADRCMSFVDSLSSNDPFFLVCSFPDPHFPFVSCKPYSEMYDPRALDVNPTWEITEESIPCLKEMRKYYRGTIESEEALRQIISQYYGMITHIDHNVGRIMSHLEAKGLAEETIVVVTADHGEYLGSHGLLYKNPWQWEELLRVPFVWRVPDAFSPGKGSAGVVSLLDLVPTLLDYAGIPQEEMQYRNGERLHRMVLPGKSLKPLLSEGEDFAHNAAFVEYDEDWVMVYGGDKSELPVYRVRSIIEERYKAIVYGNNDYGILTDLDADPYETNNLWEDPKHAEQKSRLLEVLVAYMIKTDRMETPRISSA
jgi:arylsulfatase A-like enzyme